MIVVEGQTAREKCDTCCGSYDENKGGMFRNMFKTPENRLEVECEAVNCVYNKDCFCQAEHIGITGGDTTEAQGNGMFQLQSPLSGINNKNCNNKN